MGDTLSFKITEKVIDLEHLSRSRDGSTDVLGSTGTGEYALSLSTKRGSYNVLAPY